MDGYYQYVNYTNICLCYPGYRFTDDQKNSCTKCDHNTISPGGYYELKAECYSCNSDNNVFQAPNLNNSLCLNCTFKTYNINGTNYCRCQPGTQFNETSLLCDICPQGTASSSNFILDNENIMQTCQQCQVNYVPNHNQSLCVCKDGYYGQQCQYTAQNNYIAYNKYQNQSSDIVYFECQNGIPNTQENLNFICRCNMFFMVDPITHNCIGCQNPYQYQPENDYTKTYCIDCFQYSMRDVNNFCSCIQGFYLSNNQCVLCQQNYINYQISNDSCIECTQDDDTNVYNPKFNQCSCQYNKGIDYYYQNDTTKICTEQCNQSQIIIWNSNTLQQQCENCPTNFVPSINKQECICSFGYYLNGQQCQLLQNQNQYSIYNSQYYYNCPNNTQLLADKSGCYCELGYVWNGTQCTLCPQDSLYQYDTFSNKGICQCNNQKLKWQYNVNQQKYMCMCSGFNQYYDINNKICQKCNYNSYNDNDSICLCFNIYKLDEYGNCKCNDNQYYNITIQTCIDCTNGERIYLQDDKQCYQKNQYQNWLFE